jgi:cell division protease FtsH
MNLKNLMMWGVIVLLVLGMYQLFQNPKNVMVPDKMPFSEFLKNIDDGRVVQVEIKGNDIEGVLSDGTVFRTYAPNDPNLVEKLTSKGVSITATPLEDKIPSLLGILLSWFPMLLLIGVWIFFMRKTHGSTSSTLHLTDEKYPYTNKQKHWKPRVKDA